MQSRGGDHELPPKPELRQVRSWQMRRVVAVANAYDIHIARTVSALPGTVQSVGYGPRAPGLHVAMRTCEGAPLRIERSRPLAIPALPNGLGLCFVAPGQAIAFATVASTSDIGLEAVQRAREFIKCTRLCSARVCLIYNPLVQLRALQARREQLMPPTALDARASALEWQGKLQSLANDQAFAIRSQARAAGITAIRIADGPHCIDLDGTVRRGGS